MKKIPKGGPRHIFGAKLMLKARQARRTGPGLKKGPLPWVGSFPARSVPVCSVSAVPRAPSPQYGPLAGLSVNEKVRTRNVYEKNRYENTKKTGS